MDDIDRGILYLLQRDARNTTTGEIASRLGVATSTVSARLNDLEERGVVRGYRPIVDYEAADVPFTVRVDCTVSPSRRAGLVDDVVDLHNVLDVHTYHTGESNLSVTAAGPDRGSVGGVERALADLGLTVERTVLYEAKRLQPFDHFDGAADDSFDPGE